MSAPTSPPPGSVPSGMSPDMQSTLNQMMGSSGQKNSGTGGASGAAAPGASPRTSPKPPRSIGSLPQEAQYMSEDVAQGLVNLLPDFMQQILGLKSTDTPEDAMRKKQMLQRYNQLNDEQQVVVQKQMREEHEKKQKEEQERIQKEQKA